jgi:hypothetical protein
VIGNEGTRREFLAIIRSNFDHIHRTIPRIEAIPQVPIPDRPDIVIDYRHLLILEQLGQETFVPPGLSDWVYVKNLLDGVDARSTEPVQTIPPDQIQLRNILFNRFDESELQNICFDLDVDYYSLPGEGKMNKARELVAYMRRRERLHELVKVIKRTRPDISWKDTY